MPNYYDISPLISEAIAPFVGDMPFSRKIALDFKTGNNLLLSAMTLSMHCGAHTDAPNHYHPDGESIDQRDLARYMGLCQVISLTTSRADRRLLLTDLLQKQVKIAAPRVLIHTGSYPDPNCWTDSFTGLSPELVDYLAANHVTLIGIDTPSVDPADDAELLSHQAIYRHDLAILEGIVLDKVPDGLYTLLALPLRLHDADAAPVRAILLPTNYDLSTR